MNLLRIDSSVRLENSKTRLLGDYFIKELERKNKLIVKKRDVGIVPPKFPTDEFIKANYTPEENRTSEMKNVLESSDLLINELIDTENIIIGAPMYNFSIPASLKAYIDNIVRVGKTFTLDGNGAMKGLLEGKRVLIVTSRGAMSYKENGVLQTFDFQENYLTVLLNFIGITDITFVHVEAQDFGSDDERESNFEEAKKQLEELSKLW